MVECHGSQCGFCTPGFVMSLWSSYEQHRAAGTVPTRQQLADDLSGNLCRCTGYRPILDAGQRMFELPAATLDTAPVAVQALRDMATAGPTASLRAWRAHRFHAPKHAGRTRGLREAKPDARLLAGSTDIGLWVNKQFRELGEIIYLGESPSCKRIEPLDAAATALWIGAGASLEDAWRALASAGRR
jgi:xanthine dehydrogenase small subunit